MGPIVPPMVPFAPSSGSPAARGGLKPAATPERGRNAVTAVGPNGGRFADVFQSRAGTALAPQPPITRFAGSA
jgi:hypothetical protein